MSEHLHLHLSDNAILNDVEYYIIVNYVTVPDPCGTGSTPACANGGACNRTGLTEVACQCVGSWTGMGCTGELNQPSLMECI